MAWPRPSQVLAARGHGVLGDRQGGVVAGDGLLLLAEAEECHGETKLVGGLLGRLLCGQLEVGLGLSQLADPDPGHGPGVVRRDVEAGLLASVVVALDELDCGPRVLHGLLSSPEVGQERSPRVPGLVILGLEANRLVHVGQGVLELALIPVGHAAVVEGLVVTREEEDRLAVVLDGLVQLAAALEGLPVVEPGVGVLAVEVEGLLELGARLEELAPVAEGHALVSEPLDRLLVRALGVGRGRCDAAEAERAAQGAEGQERTHHEDLQWVRSGSRRLRGRACPDLVKLADPPMQRQGPARDSHPADPREGAAIQGPGA